MKSTTESVPAGAAGKYRVDNGDSYLYRDDMGPEPEKGTYFLTCTKCRKIDYFHWKHFPPRCWHFYADNIVATMLYPAPPYICDECRRPLPLKLSKTEYQDYLKSDHWQTVRSEALERATHKCQMCGSTHRLDVHHNTYRTLGIEQPEDVITICRKCHSKHHDKVL